VAAGEEIVIARAGKPVARLVPIEEKLELPEPPARYVPTRLERGGFTPMSVEHAHALRVFELPRHHRDPFDRLLIAQAQLEGATLATADPMFLLYDIDALWAGAGEPPQAVHDADGRRRKVAGSVDSNGVRRRTRSRSRTGSAASRRSRASQGRKPK
jgi:antitoxin (DNA-binding transcriptional repressor) of toxin-antitoxin stability system